MSGVALKYDKYEKDKEALSEEYDSEINEFRDRIHKCVISDSQLEMNWSYKVNTEFIPGVKSGKYKERYPQQRDVFVVPYMNSEKMEESDEFKKINR